MDTIDRTHRSATRKLALTAMFTCLAFVLNTFVYFPAMAPFQHFVNVLSAVFVGPWYGSAAGFLTGVMRMACGRDVGSVTGAMIGPIVGGLLYRKFGTWWSVYIGEVFGTGVLGAMASYPLFRMFYGRSVPVLFHPLLCAFRRRRRGHGRGRPANPSAVRPAEADDRPARRMIRRMDIWTLELL